MSNVEFKILERCPETECLACKKTCNSKEFIQAANVTYRKCESCRSFSVIDRSMVNENYQNLSSDFWIDYVEMNAGIESMLSFVERCLPEDKIDSFIDVGCGFGFVVDYIKRTYGANSLGLEKSLYGKVGSEKLNINIRPEYSDEYCASDNTRFDVVYSSEVIEHVADPLAFLNQLKELCSINGRVIITTPNSNYINETADYAIINAVLSPRHHFFIVSPEQLKKLMTNAGFLNVKIVEVNERILATASVEKSTKTIIKDDFKKSKYINYLIDLEYIDDPIISNSASVKLYKEFINMGDYNAAQSRWCKLSKHFIEDRGFNIDEFDTSRLLDIVNVKDYARSLPYYFGVLKFYRAMHLVNHAGDLSDMFYHFSTVTEILSKEIELSMAHFQESNSLIENSKFHTALGLVSVTESLLKEGQEFSQFWRDRLNNEVLKRLHEISEWRFSK